jgi:hypothetical protein
MRRSAIFGFLSLLVTAGVVATTSERASIAANAVHPTVGGALTELAGKSGCFVYGANPLCTPSPNLYAPKNLAVSPDGKQVATVSDSYDVVVIWDRGKAGKLSFSRCISLTGTAGTGDTAYSCLPDAQLDEPSAAYFTADGKSLLITSNNSLVNLDRNPTTGALTPNGLTPCVNVDGSGGCSKVRSLADANSIGEFDFFDHGEIYVGSGSNSGGALIAFRRDPSTRRLDKFDCLNESGTIGCREDVALDGVSALTVDQNSGTIWATSYYGGTLNSFYINTTGSASLDPIKCFWSSATTSTCTRVKAIVAPTGLTMSQGDSGTPRSIYVTDYNNDALVEFADNNDTGFGVYEGCRSYTGTIPDTGAPCAMDPNVQGAVGVVVSADNKSVYVAAERSNPAQGAQVVAAYSRDTGSGAISPLPAPYACVRSPDVSPNCAVANGMYDPFLLAITPDGSNVYVMDRLGNGFLTLQRSLPPTCRAVAKHTKHDKAARFSLHCKDPNDDSLGYVITKVKHGKVGKVKHGKVTFTPKKHFKGTASFKVAVTDGGLASQFVRDTLHTTKSKH